MDIYGIKKICHRQNFTNKMFYLIYAIRELTTSDINCFIFPAIFFAWKAFL